MPAAICSFVLAIAGLVISGYLSYEHFTGSKTLACSDTGLVNCLKVTTSQWSVILGLPVAVAGFAFFAGMVLFCLPMRAVANWHVLRIVCCVIGIGMVLWLVYVELFKVDAICVWCTSVHVITLALLGCVIWWRESARGAED